MTQASKLRVRCEPTCQVEKCQCAVGIRGDWKSRRIEDGGSGKASTCEDFGNVGRLGIRGKWRTVVVHCAAQDGIVEFGAGRTERERGYGKKGAVDDGGTGLLVSKLRQPEKKS